LLFLNLGDAWSRGQTTVDGRHTTEDRGHPPSLTAVAKAMAVEKLWRAGTTEDPSAPSMNSGRSSSGQADEGRQRNKMGDVH
jgi:hypothetical protein